MIGMTITNSLLNTVMAWLGNLSFTLTFLNLVYYVVFQTCNWAVDELVQDKVKHSENQH